MHANPVIDSLPYFVSSDLPLIKATYTLQQPNTYSRLGQPQLQHHPDLEADKLHDCKNKQVEDRDEPHLKQILLP